MKTYNLENNKLSENSFEIFETEKEIQNLVEDNLTELFGFDFIGTEFKIELIHYVLITLQILLLL